MSPDLTYPTRQFTSGVASLNIPPTPPTPNSMGGQQKSPNHLVVPQPVKPRPNGKSFQCKMCEQVSKLNLILINRYTVNKQLLLFISYDVTWLE